MVKHFSSICFVFYFVWVFLIKIIILAIYVPVNVSYCIFGTDSNKHDILFTFLLYELSNAKELQ